MRNTFIVIFLLFVSCCLVAENFWLAAVYQNGRWGFINQKNSLVIPCLYNDTGDFHDGLCAVKNGDYWGYVDTHKQLVIYPAYTYADSFSEGVAPVKTQQTDKYGYINTEGKWVIPQKFQRAFPFSEGVAVVQDTINQPPWVLVNYINHEGKIVNPTPYTRGGSFKEGKAFVGIDDSTLYCVDKNFKVLFTVSDAFDTSCSSYSEGLSAVEKGIEDWEYDDYYYTSWFIDDKGQIAIDQDTEYVQSFSEGMAGLSSYGKTKFINHDGQEIFTIEFGDPAPFHGGMSLCRQDYKYGFIDKTGKFVIKPQYDNARSFSR